MSDILYLQIYTSQYVCQTFPSIPQIYLLLTKKRSKLKQDGSTNEGFLVSQNKNIRVLITYDVDLTNPKDLSNNPVGIICRILKRFYIIHPTKY